jgi:hypothetical protein
MLLFPSLFPGIWCISGLKVFVEKSSRPSMMLTHCSAEAEITVARAQVNPTKSDLGN